MKQMEKSQTKIEEYSTSRVEAFSDGIFAIAITLLVLNIQLPRNASEITIDRALQLSIPKLEVWIISFFIIGGMWIRHHKLIKQIKRIDTLFIKLNLIYLMFVTVIPWLVSLIVVYSSHPMSVAVFSGGIALIGLINLFIWIYLAKIKKTIAENVTEYEKNLHLLNIIMVILLPLGTIFVAFCVSNRLALYCYLLNPILDSILRLLYRRPGVNLNP
jgi:uncharacterized membrane protein